MVSVCLFVYAQFDVYDEYLFNAVSIACQLANRYDNASDLSPITNDSAPITRFNGLNGIIQLAPLSGHVQLYYSVWDFDPSYGSFYLRLQTSEASSWTYVIASDKPWPNGRTPPGPDSCDFTSCPG